MILHTFDSDELLRERIASLLPEESTTVSKLQQEVTYAVRQIPECRAILNCQDYCIEKDMVVTSLEKK